MILSTQQKLDRLIKAFDENREEDAATVLENWRDQIEGVEREHAEFLKATAQPTMYGLMFGREVPQSSDDGHQFSQYQPTDKYRVRADDMGRFAVEQRVPVERLMDVVEGKIRDYAGWRSMEGRGLSNRPYKSNLRDKLATLKEMREADKRQERHLSRQPVYQTQKEVEIKDYGIN